MEMQWNLQCGIMWNQYEPQQEYECTAERTVSNLRTTCPMHFQLRLRTLALRCSKAKQGELGIAFKENDRKKTCHTSEKPFAATASLESLFLCGLTSFAAQCWAATCRSGPPGSSGSPVPKNGTAFDFFGRPMDPPNEPHSNWENFCNANFGMTFHFLCNFGVAKKAQLRIVRSGPSNTEQMNPYHFCHFLPKPQTQCTARWKMCVDPKHTIAWEVFGRFHSSEVLRTCWACGSRVWFPNKDSQSIASKVLPNLGIQSTESLGKKWHETKGPHPLQPVQPFFLSDEQRSPAVAIKQQTACSATAGFGFSHASGAPHSRGMIVMVIKSHPPDLSIYVDIHTFTCFKPSRLSTLG